MNFVFLAVTFISLCFLPDQSIGDAGVLRNLDQINDYLQRSDQNLIRINFYEDVQITILNNTVQLVSKSNNVLINTPNSSVLLTKFNTVSLKINSAQSSSHRDSFNQSSFENHLFDRQRNEERFSKNLTKETPVNLKEWKDSLLLEGSKKLDQWLNSTNLTYTTEFCLFNVTNIEDIELGKKPILQELCGYVFRQNRTSQIDSWREEEKYILVKQKRSYNFIGQLDLNQNITILNVPLVYLYDQMNQIRNQSSLLIRPMIERLLIRYLKKYPMFITKSVGDVLFRGYRDNLLKELRSLKETMQKIGVFHKLLRLPYYINEWGDFSLFGFRNNTDNGLLTVNTGKFNLGDVGQISEINRNDINSYYSSPCNIIKGTDGVVHSPHTNGTDSIDVYVTQFNRSVSFVNEPFNHYSQIKRFKMSKNTLDSGDSHAPNRCYRLKNSDSQLANIDGILTPLPNEPIVYSNPHFNHYSFNNGFFRDPIFLSKANNTNNITSEYESFIDLDANTGDLIRQKMAYQVNFDTKCISKERNLHRFIFPVYWVNENTFTNGRTFE